MSISPFLLIHICTAMVGLLSGAMAVVFPKGSGWHAAAGNVFFVSMLGMSSSAAYIATFLRPNHLNLMMGLLTFYLVATAWLAAKRRDGKIGLVDWGALLFILADGAAGVTWGLQAAASQAGTKDGMAPAFYFTFGTIALLCAAADIRMIVQGGFTGGRRIARHLWRMCFALWIAAMSLYPGQAKLFPKALRDTNLLIVPQLLLIVFTIWSLYRVLRRSKAKRRTQPDLATATQPKSVAA
jgi:uncharacterized membrane protein